jgi:hypothetical protein
MADTPNTFVSGVLSLEELCAAMEALPSFFKTSFGECISR